MKLKVRHHKTVRGFLIRIKQQTRTHTRQKNQHELQRASSYCELQLQNSPLVISMCLFVQHIFSIKTSLYQSTHFCVLLIFHALNAREFDHTSVPNHSFACFRKTAQSPKTQARREDVSQSSELARSIFGERSIFSERDIRDSV